MLCTVNYESGTNLFEFEDDCGMYLGKSVWSVSKTPFWSLYLIAKEVQCSGMFQVSRQSALIS